MVDVALYLRFAKVAQVKDTVKIAQQLAFNGKTTVPDYVRLLYIVRKSVEFMFANNPSDPNLEDVANYMYTLSGKRSLTPSVPINPLIIILNPISQTVTVGTVVTFTVAAAGGVLPYTYQWIYNGTPIGGATNPSLTINPAVLGSAGAYDCIVRDVNGQTVTSAIANLVVNAGAITGSFYYGGTDYFAALSGGTDAISYQGTFPITHNAPLSIPYPLAAADNMFLVIRVPIGESLKTTWFNTPFNNGTIQPTDGIFRVPLQPVGLPLYTYYLTWLQVSNDFSQPLILT